MEQLRKHLKINSLVVLLFAALSLLEIVTELLFGALNDAQIPEGAPENILTITKVFLLVLTLVLLLPQVYVGLRGLRIAKNPVPAKGHIIWATILLVLTALGLIEPAAAMVKGAFSENFSAVARILLEVAIYYDYINSARAVAKQLQE